MAARTATYTWNDVLSLSLFYYAKSGKIPDNVFKGLVALEYMLSSDALDTEYDGGAVIKEPLMYGSNSTAGSYRGYDVVDVTPQDNFTDAEFYVKQNKVSISISGLELASINGPMMVKNLLKARIENAEISLRDVINQQLWADGTGNNSKDITGFPAVAPEGGAGTYGGINSAVETWWKSQSKAAVGSFASGGRSKMVEFYKTLSQGRTSGRPSVIIGTQNFHNYYEKSLQVNERYNLDGNSKTIDGSIGALLFKDVPVEFDFQCPVDSGTNDQAFWLNFNYLKLKIHKSRYFAPTPFKTPPDQDASVAQILLYGELCCSNRRHQGRFYGITA